MVARKVFNFYLYPFSRFASREARRWNEGSGGLCFRCTVYFDIRNGVHTPLGHRGYLGLRWGAGRAPPPCPLLSGYGAIFVCAHVVTFVYNILFLVDGFGVSRV